MKKIIKNTLLAFALLLWCGCSDPAPRQQTVTVMFVPVGAVLRAVTAGTGIGVAVVVPAGKDVHEYEPTSLDLRPLENGGAFLSLGTVGEQRISDTVAKLGGDVVMLAPSLARIPFSADDDDDDGDAHADHAGHDHGSTDPHVWLSPLNCAAIAESAGAILAERYPEHAEKLLANAAEYARNMRELSDRISKQLAPFAGRRFYVLHPAFGYFARDYNLVQCALEQDGKRPSPMSMQKVFESARADGVKCVYASPEFNLIHPMALAKSLDAKLVLLSPLPEDPAAAFQDIADKLAAGFEAEKRP